ncbi:Pre-mRNA cleavage complex II protein Clp1-domain-containing protein [Thamnocephalis sphaerospora]|uniref:Polynucleotide 5'-hydroxyl-kinase GRC3 n=1 Tax=Thamnocephalis sphaerospora TaxID=78915 RepID=A0A4P9XGJ0_9FUNG|nr:Pre-mRNA cleavage complex II protein Clp1-domain-containing protein [Thamnocephalis sphaerospora]|eukprot:RKP04708.1 Pre-mRNA cleavage complex II protein Clp1-domain-containing protein [Thamnocephalis sphaerospora]
MNSLPDSSSIAPLSGNTASDTARVVRLAPESELRIEVEFGYSLTLKLIEGVAEVFGCEIIVGREYRFSGQKLGVFTWQAAGGADYVADDTPMPIFLNIHTALEQRRATAETMKTSGPRVVVVGAHDSGKTSLVKLLLNYAVRQGRQPMFVNLDISEGGVTMPGTVSAVMVDQPIYPEEEFGSLGLDLTAAGGSGAPIVYHYGFDTPNENTKLLQRLVGHLADTVTARLVEDDDARQSGLIIDTHGCADHNEFELLMHIIKSFSADVVLVLGHERLHSDLLRAFQQQPQSNISILKLTKLGGVARRDKSFRRQSQVRKIREYFYGHPGNCELSPFSLVVGFGDVNIFRVGEEHLVPSSALPLGADRKAGGTRLVAIEAGDILLHSILAIVDAAPRSASTAGAGDSTNESQTQDEEDFLVLANVLGFVYVSDVNSAKRKMTVLAPSATRLPSNRLVMGVFKWAETV